MYEQKHDSFSFWTVFLSENLLLFCFDSGKLFSLPLSHNTINNELCMQIYFGYFWTTWAEFSATWDLYSKHSRNPFLAALRFCPIPSGKGRVSKLGGFCLQLCHIVSGALSYCSKALHPASSLASAGITSPFRLSDVYFPKAQIQQIRWIYQHGGCTRRSLANCKNAWLLSKGVHVRAESLWGVHPWVIS